MLPNVWDVASARIIEDMLEIKQVLSGPYPSQAAALQANNGIIPADQLLLPGNTLGGRAEGEQWFLVSRVSAISGKDLKRADPSTDQNGQPDVNFQLTRDGGQRFFNFTSAHVKDSLGVVLDGKVREVASINEPIRDQVQISGHMDPQAAKDLSMILNSGALPASIHYLEERTVGPSLGADSIRSGVRAAVIGMLAVLVFMAKVNNPEQMPDADKEDALLVSITRDGKVYFGSEQITVDNLTTKVKDRLANKADKRVYVKADMRTRFGGVVQVVDSVRAAGVDDLGLLTDQRKTTPNPPPTPAQTGQAGQ